MEDMGSKYDRERRKSSSLAKLGSNSIRLALLEQAWQKPSGLQNSRRFRVESAGLLYSGFRYGTGEKAEKDRFSAEASSRNSAHAASPRPDFNPNSVKR